ncbi:MAG: hemolysin D [Novosphingobium sp. SCN 63-17]|nr:MULTISPECIES: efflux RND transporter periplasmic adaptor subunit [unclassified Novosphingobium]MBN9144825.1 efflux RND transporter periplasmic adaptor subunit [Novosphingobium sp.]MDR6708080.1 membrane fusion protein (multidrug efflux system) [Novosphingobium sp. 1748]ODU82190.1 MAG: hemolysin D [Novosphingobium sp. SCN 63-17]OJX92403.1 MAG: HlyD family secretion protein [Novosphingobium sp. 63-713]
MADSYSPPPAKNAARRKGLLMLGVAALVGLAGYGVYTMMSAANEETDDAYVAGNVTQITARDPGTVIAVHAESTQGVKAGQPLVDLDPALADAQLAAAEAELARAARTVRSGFTKVGTADAEIAQAEVRLAAARSDLTRREKAVSSGAISAEEVAHAGEAVRMAQANLDLARSHRADAESTVGGTDVAGNPAVLAAIAAVKRAAIVRSHMHLSSPVDGVVAQRAAQVGQQVAPGAPLMSVVPLRKVWVDANFRETQLANLRIGQSATLHSDAYGKKVVFHGKVIGLSAGSGAAFALLPAQNASGNWIKVVQRVPVRIALDPKELDAHPLRLGLSVTVKVDTSQGTGQPVTAIPAAAQASEPVDTVSPEIEARIRRIIAANAGR